MELTGAVWRKSSRSGPNGGACVEIAAVWRKSTRSGVNGGNCVEVARRPDTIAVRDSKDPDGPKLGFTRAQFAAFLAGTRHDRRPA